MMREIKMVVAWFELNLFDELNGPTLRHWSCFQLLTRPNQNQHFTDITYNLFRSYLHSDFHRRVKSNLAILPSVNLSFPNILWATCLSKEYEWSTNLYRQVVFLPFVPKIRQWNWHIVNLVSFIVHCDRLRLNLIKLYLFRRLAQSIY